jgi:hypothetical protein
MSLQLTLIINLRSVGEFDNDREDMARYAL